MKPEEILREINKKNAEYNSQLSRLLGMPVQFVDIYNNKRNNEYGQKRDFKRYVKPIGRTIQ